MSQVTFPKWQQLQYVAVKQHILTYSLCAQNNVKLPLHETLIVLLPTLKPEDFHTLLNLTYCMTPLEQCFTILSTAVELANTVCTTSPCMVIC